MLFIATQLISSQSGGISPLRNAVQWARALLVTRGSVSSRRMTSCRLMYQARTPPGSSTWVATPCARSWSASAWMSAPVMSRTGQRCSMNVSKIWRWPGSRHTSDVRSASPEHRGGRGTRGYSGSRIDKEWRNRFRGSYFFLTCCRRG